MEQIAISKFKATCLAVLHGVSKTGRPVQVTRFGKPIAEIVPPTPEPTPKRWLGAMAGSGEILGDIVSPALPAEAWEAIGGKPRRKARRRR